MSRKYPELYFKVCCKGDDVKIFDHEMFNGETTFFKTELITTFKPFIDENSKKHHRNMKVREAPNIDRN